MSWVVIKLRGVGSDQMREFPVPELLFPLDSSKSFTEQKIIGHNRWHPDIPAPGDRETR